jgi:hypothetical protein
LKQAEHTRGLSSDDMLRFCGFVWAFVKTLGRSNVRRFSRSEAPASLRAERHAALPDVFNQSASGVTPLILGDPRRFSAGRGERPAVGCEQQLASGQCNAFLIVFVVTRATECDTSARVLGDRRAASYVTSNAYSASDTRETHGNSAAIFRAPATFSHFRMRRPGPPPRDPQLPFPANETETVRQLLQEAPLYRPAEYRVLGLVRLPATIEMFCSSTTCAKAQLHDLQQGSVLEHATYQCRNCKSGKYRFMLEWDRFHEDEQRSGPLGVDTVYYEVGNVTKVGQQPPPNDRISSALEKRLGKTRASYYRTALRLRTFNLGIGALAYMRRVVEEMAGVLLDTVADEAELEGTIKVDREKLREVRNSRTFDDKMEFAKAILPTRLAPGGHNPIDKLHDVTSAGLHGESEEACLRTFDAARPVFEFFFAELPERLTKEKEFRKQVSDLGKPTSG